MLSDVNKHSTFSIFQPTYVFVVAILPDIENDCVIDVALYCMYSVCTVCVILTYLN